MGLFKNSVKTIRDNQSSNSMWMTVIVELVGFALAIKFDMPLVYCSIFLIIPVFVNIITNTFNLVALLLCVLETFGILWASTGDVEDSIFYSVLLGAGLSFISFIKHNFRFQQDYKVRRTRTGRYKR